MDSQQSLRSPQSETLASRSLTLNNPIEVVPSDIRFQNVEPNKQYEMDVLVRNLSNKVRKIRFLQPKSNKFSAIFENTGPLAPGIATKVTIVYRSGEHGNFHDELSVISTDFSYKLGLHAYKVQAEIQFKSLVDLGYVEMNRQSRFRIPFVNKSKTSGRVSLQFDQKACNDIQFDKTDFEVAGGKKTNVLLTYYGQTPGDNRYTIEVHIAGDDSVKYIDINVICVQHQFSILLPENEISHAYNSDTESNYDPTTGRTKEPELLPVSEVEFSTIYHGQKRSKSAWIANNGPIPAEYSVAFHEQGNNTDEKTAATKSPQEIANENLHSIMAVNPPTGTIPPYSQIPIQFICHPKVIENPRRGILHNKMDDINPAIDTHDDHDEKNMQDFFYSACFSFADIDQQMNIQLRATAQLPLVRLSTNYINFGSCEVNGRKDYELKIENMNQEASVDFRFGKLCQFRVETTSGVIPPSSVETVNLTFKPNNFGVFNGTLMLTFVRGAYKVPIKIAGKALEQGSKKNLFKGPGWKGRELAESRNFVPLDSIGVSSVIERSKNWYTESLTLTMTESMQSNFSMRNEKNMLNRYASAASISHLRSMRTERLDMKRHVSLKKLGKTMPKTEDDIHADCDIGIERSLKPTRISLPKLSDSLMAKGPVGNLSLSQTAKIHNHDPDKLFHNSYKVKGEGKQFKEIKYHTRPQGQLEIAHCTQELSSAELRQISAGPTKIDFESVVLKSIYKKVFSVVNDLGEFIFVELTAKNFEEMRAIKPQSLVIPPGKTGFFELELCSTHLKKISQIVSYKINTHHEFSFEVIASIEPAVLELSKHNMNFAFEEGFLEEVISKKLSIANRSNATVEYSWQKIDENFYVIPATGSIDAYGKAEATINFQPINNSVRVAEDKLTLKVENGDLKLCKVRGEVYEVKCTLEAKQGEKPLDFGTICVGKKEERSIYIKNRSRTMATYHIKNIPKELTIFPERDKMSSESKHPIKVTFQSSTVKKMEGEVEISVRGGGKPISVPFSANAIIPAVSIQQPAIEFGQITCGNTSVETFTLCNESIIPCTLFLDFRDIPELQIFLTDTDEDPTALAIHHIDQNSPYYEQDDDDLDVLQNQIEDTDEETMDDLDEKTDMYSIYIAPQSSIQYTMKFTPTSTDSFMIDMPLIIEGINRGIPAIKRPISGTGLKPSFVMEPSEIDFRNKVVTSGEKSFAIHKTTTISNPDIYPLKWKADTKIMDKYRVFSMHPKEGVIESGESMSITVSFTPSSPIEYDDAIDFYIDESKKPYIQLKVKGVGTMPRIIFDRREVILPLVPLGETAKATFQIINDGCESIELHHKLSESAGPIPLHIEFVDGNLLGITRTKLQVEVCFESKKPFSFTAVVDFYYHDENQDYHYSLPISGTTDNSIFTSYPFLQRHSGEWEYNLDENNAIKVSADEFSNSSFGGKMAYGRTSGASSVVSRSPAQFFGYNPIPIDALTKSLELIGSWLNNSTPLSTNVGKMPEEFIKSAGELLVELLGHMTTKKLPTLKRVNTSQKDRNEPVRRLISNYEEILVYLAQQGCLLNTVRPEYLLSFEQYQQFQILNPKPDVMQMRKSRQQSFWEYVSADAWVTLINQIMKIYILNRITPKTFRGIAGIEENITTVEPSMRNSNIYSLSETILLKWAESHNQRITSNQKQLINLEQDFNDGLVYAAIIKSHVGTHDRLLGMYERCQTSHQYISNMDRVVSCLGDLGITTHVASKDLAIDPNPINVFLFLILLYNSLPNYVPKTTINFKSILGETSTKRIELKNPSNRSIIYSIHLEGKQSKDFFIQDDLDEIALNPKGNTFVNVKFHARVSADRTAKLSFIGRRSDSKGPAAALVFNLNAVVTERKSEQVIEMQACLYETLMQEVEIINKFDQDAEFTIEVQMVDKNASTKQIPARRSSGRNSASYVQSSNESSLMMPKMPPAFHVNKKKDKITIKKNATARLNVQFLPFEMIDYEANVIFLDSKVGEMQYTLHGSVDMPKDDKIDKGARHFKQDAGDKAEHSLQLTFNNAQFDKAKDACDKRYMLSNMARERETYLKALNDSQVGTQATFEVSVDSPYFTYPSTVTLYGNTQQKGNRTKGYVKDKSIISQASGSKQNTSDDTTNLKPAPVQQKVPVSRQQTRKESMAAPVVDKSNTLKIGLDPKNPGEYHATVTLTCLERYDIRVIEVAVQVKPKSKKYTLEFKAPARTVVEQQLPIENKSPKDWAINVQFQPGDKGWFKLSSKDDILVPKRGSRNITITFAPQWVFETQAVLTLQNITTQEVHKYTLQGTGQSPISEGTLSIECRAREALEKVIELPKNTTERPIAYRTECDIACITGEASITVPPGQVESYKLHVEPNKSGFYSGSICFTDTKGVFYWYMIELNCLQPDSEKLIALEAQCRKAVAVEITVQNPINEPTVFNVNLNGEGLLGEPAFTVGPKEVGVYELLFSPLIPMNVEGSIFFESEMTGEFWYKLHLKATPADEIEVPRIKCELGKNSSVPMIIENPTKNQVILKQISSTRLFDIEPEKVIIQPWDAAEFFIRYFPCSLETVDKGTIELSNKKHGKWIYNVSGEGLTPSEMDTIQITSKVGQTSSAQINFKNPFNEPTNIEIFMQEDNVFKLLLKRTKFLVPPLGTLLIPVSYFPENMDESQSEVVVEMREKDLTWRFPITGITEQKSDKIDYKFRVKTRELLEDVITLPLEGLVITEEESFYHEIVVKDAELQKLVDKSFKVHALKNILSDAEEPLEFNIRFEPFKPFKTQIEFLVYKATGGRWKYNILLDAKKPDLDDIITIECEMNRQAKVSFKLCNQFKAYDEFKAYFTTESDNCFALEPKKGTLEPFGKEGTPFFITYSPAEYGGGKKAMLIIETDDMQWTYGIKGIPPIYRPPEAKGGRLDNHRKGKHVSSTTRTSKDFINKNIKSNRS